MKKGHELHVFHYNNSFRSHYSTSDRMKLKTETESINRTPLYPSEINLNATSDGCTDTKELVHLVFRNMWIAQFRSNHRNPGAEGSSANDCIIYTFI